MNAPKINHTVVLEKPLNAHLMLSAGSLNAGSANCLAVNGRPNTAANTTPTRPIAAAGTGSKIKPTTTATNSAKYSQAVGARPAGAGNNASTTPTATTI